MTFAIPPASPKNPKINIVNTSPSASVVSTEPSTPSNGSTHDSPTLGPLFRTPPKKTAPKIFTFSPEDIARSQNSSQTPLYFQSPQAILTQHPNTPVTPKHPLQALIDRSYQSTQQVRHLPLISGGYFTGEVKDGLCHGYGISARLDGEIYVGEFKKDLQWGVGAWWGTQKCSYIGECVEGKFHGKGVFTSPDGSTYYGRFENGLRHGLGVVYDQKGAIAYQGEWRNGNLFKPDEFAATIIYPAQRAIHATHSAIVENAKKLVNQIENMTDCVEAKSEPMQISPAELLLKC